MIMTMFATSIKFVKLVNMIILRFLRFLRFLGFLAKYIVKWLKCQKFNNSIIRAIELLRSRQIKRSRIQEDKLSRTLPIKKSSLSHRSARCMLVLAQVSLQ